MTVTSGELLEGWSQELPTENSQDIPMEPSMDMPYTEMSREMRSVMTAEEPEGAPALGSVMQTEMTSSSPTFLSTPAVAEQSNGFAQMSDQSNGFAQIRDRLLNS